MVEKRMDKELMELWETIIEDWKYQISQEREKEVDFIIRSCKKTINEAKKLKYTLLDFPRGFLFLEECDWNKTTDQIEGEIENGDIHSLVDRMLSWGFMYHRKYREPFMIDKEAN